jgi:hypothetical protein
VNAANIFLGETSLGPLNKAYKSLPNKVEKNLWF